MAYDKVIVARDGEKITVNADFSLNVPNNRVDGFFTTGMI